MTEEYGISHNIQICWCTCIYNYLLLKHKQFSQKQNKIVLGF